jgi:hypothetical protein
MAVCDSRELQLVDLVETYFPLTDEARRRYKQLISREEYREVQDVELTYFDRLRQEGREEGLVRGKRETLERQLVAEFGPLPAAIEARIGASTVGDWSIAWIKDRSKVWACRKKGIGPMMCMPD